MNTHLSRCRFFLLTLAMMPALALGLFVSAQEGKVTDKLIATQAGNMPIILSAPHGGTVPIPDVPERKGEGLVKGSSGFVVVRDTGTEELAFQLAKTIEAKTGKKPYYVVAHFARKFIDPNRPAEIAYESPKAKPTYDAYHGALREYCKDVQKKFGHGLLIDLHGQGAANDTIIRGTQNGKTVTLLVQRYGKQAHFGPKSFFGLLDAAGCKTHPTKEDEKEWAGFTGGHIVQTYGSHQGYGIDAIQLEFGGDYRAKARRDDTATKVAKAIEGYSKLYLPEKK